jgi:hypothetical protein
MWIGAAIPRNGQGYALRIRRKVDVSKDKAARQAFPHI